jgi:hypothetical protein
MTGGILSEPEVVDTLTVAVPETDIEPLTDVAVIVAVPEDTPVTTPELALIVATPVLLEENVVVAPENALPF